MQHAWRLTFGANMTDAAYLALLLDPRPRMQRFVKNTTLLGSTAVTRGSTIAVQRACNGIKRLAAACVQDSQLPPDKCTHAAKEHLLVKQLQAYLEPTPATSSSWRALNISQANNQWLDVSAQHQTGQRISARWAREAMIPLHDTVAGGV